MPMECRMEDSAYDQYQIRANVRKAFVPKRDFRITEEVVPDTASILSVERPAPIDVEDDSRIYPSQSVINPAAIATAIPVRTNPSFHKR